MYHNTCISRFLGTEPKIFLFTEKKKKEKEKDRK